MASSSSHQKEKQVVMEEAQSPQNGSSTITGTKWRHDTLVGTKKFSKKQLMQHGASPSEECQVSKLLLPHYVDMEDHDLLSTFSKLHEILEFQGWIQFVT